MNYGFYNFINHDGISPLPFIFYDTGVELRNDISYYFDNSNRMNYDGFIIQYTLSGYGEYNHDGEIIRLKENMGFITEIPNNCSYYFPKDSDHWKYIYVHFGGYVAKQLYDEIVAATGNTFSLPGDSSSLQLLFSEYNRIEQGMKYKRFQGGRFIYSLLTNLLCELSSPQTGYHNIEKAIEWMNANYSADISLAELCSGLNITQEHFSRQFSAVTGISPIKYLTNIRLEHAMTLLATTDFEIEKIAALCGFNSGNYFSKVFRKRLGFSPSDYRTNH
ncbi:MAG: helix-turn-helix domain-containing protein [Lachnospiraceae bacterium]|nr:helix-turn-helix domain-containing protein [Lachnospiraceae bacterium]